MHFKLVICPKHIRLLQTKIIPDQNSYNRIIQGKDLDNFNFLFNNSLLKY